jgi:hypothetical protein
LKQISRQGEQENCCLRAEVNDRPWLLSSGANILPRDEVVPSLEDRNAGCVIPGAEKGRMELLMKTDVKERIKLSILNSI